MTVVGHLNNKKTINLNFNSHLQLSRQLEVTDVNHQRSFCNNAHKKLLPQGLPFNLMTVIGQLNNKKTINLNFNSHLQLSRQLEITSINHQRRFCNNGHKKLLPQGLPFNLMTVIGQLNNNKTINLNFNSHLQLSR